MSALHETLFVICDKSIREWRGFQLFVFRAKVSIFNAKSA